MTNLTAQDFPVSIEQQKHILQRYLQIAIRGKKLKPHDVPQVAFIGGQPGSGKSRTINNVLTNMGGGLVIDSDELRLLHPDIKRISQLDPLRMDVLSNGPVGEWTKSLITYAREHRFNVIIENTFARSEIMAAEAENFEQAGYQCSFTALAVPESVSRLGIVDRYRAAVQGGNIPRWTSEVSHTNACKGISSTMQELLLWDATSEVTIVSRSGDQNIIVDSPDQVEDAIAYIRESSFTQEDILRWRDTYAQAVDFVLQNDLVTDYSHTLLTNLAKDAEELLGNDVPANHETFHLALKNDLLLEGNKDEITTSHVEILSEQQSVYSDEDLVDNTANVDDDNIHGLSM